MLPPRGGGPRLERGDRLLAKGVGLLPGGEHPPPVDPSAEIGGDGHVRGRGDHPVRELAPRPSDGGEEPPEAFLGGEPLPLGNGKRLGNGHRGDLVAAIRGPGEGHPRDVFLQHLGREREPGEPVPLRPPFDPVPAPQLVHLLHAHQARVVVLVTGERQAVALDRVGDEAGGFVAPRGRLERFHHRLDVVAGEVRHQPGKSIVVELVEDRPHPGDLPDVLGEALAPRRPALEYHCRVEGVRAVVNPLPERVAPAPAEHPLELLAVLEGLDPPAHVPEQVVEPAVQPVGDHRVEALPVVVDNPPQVPDLVLPALQQRLEDVPLVELGVSGKGDHASVRAATGHPLVGPDVVPDDAREEGRGDPEPHRPGRKVDVVLVLGARGIGLRTAKGAEPLQVLAGLAPEEVLDGMERRARVRLDRDPVPGAEDREIERGHQGDDRRARCLVPADLQAVLVGPDVVRVVDRPAREPQHLAFELAQHLESVGRRLADAPFGPRTVRRRFDSSLHTPFRSSRG